MVVVVRAVVGSAAALVLVVGASPAEAKAPDAVGWWSEARLGALLPADTPTTVPEGGLYVAGDPGGPFGISALRADVLDLDVTEVVLEIDSVQGTPALRACAVVVVWAPEHGGPMSSAPPYDCAAGAIDAVVEENRVRIPAAALVQDGFLNFILEPQPGAVFQATFKAPTDATIVASPKPSPGAETFAGSETYASSDLGQSDGFDRSAFSAPTPAAGTSFGPPPESVEAPATSGDAVAAPRSVPSPSAPIPLAPDNPRIRMVAALIVFNLLLAAMWLMRHSIPPRLVGPFARFLPAPVVDAGSDARGIGRFARPRSGSVPRL